MAEDYKSNTTPSNNTPPAAFQAYVQPAANALLNNPITYKALQVADMFGLDFNTVKSLLWRHPNTEAYNKRLQDELFIDSGGYANAQIGNTYRMGEVYGLPIFDRWVTLGNVNDDNDNLLIEFCFMTLDRKHDFIVTPILGLNDSTIKELQSRNDFNVTIKAAFFSDDPYTRPLEKIQKLVSYLDNGIVRIVSPILDKVFPKNVFLAVTGYNIQEPENYKNAINFTITALTDTNIDVITS